MMVQQDEPDDYVLATGESHSVREFVEKAFRKIGVDLEWRGEGVEESGLDSSNGRVLVEVDPRYFRPTEVDLLIGDPTKAHEKLGWRHETSSTTLSRKWCARTSRSWRAPSAAGAGRGFGHD